jgi:pimeloyl-ACP methyl ester carboxylesterase
MVYVPGLDGTGELFFNQAAELSETYRVVTFRMRDDSSFTYADLAADVAAIIKDLGERTATIVGESFGGTVALSFALTHPEMVEKLVVVNSFPRFRRRIRLRALSLLTTAVPLALIAPARVAANLLGLYIDRVTPESRRRFFSAMRRVGPAGYARRIKLIEGFDVEGSLDQIASPALLIAGSRDIVVPSRREAMRMSRRMQRATVLVVDGAGHACLLGRFRLAAALRTWNAASQESRFE